jgi:hypothetical protein
MFQHGLVKVFLLPTRYPDILLFGGTPECNDQEQQGQASKAVVDITNSCDQSRCRIATLAQCAQVEVAPGSLYFPHFVHI